jgi:hypothetical protein
MEAIRYLISSNCVGPDEKPGIIIIIIIINGCSEVFTPHITYILNLNLLQGMFPSYGGKRVLFLF